MNLLQTTILVCFLAYNVLAQAGNSINQNISFMYYYGRDINSFTTIPYSQGLAILTLPTFNTSACTIFVYPGFNEKPALTNANYCSKIVVSELLPYTSCNVIVIDYSSLVNNSEAGTTFAQITMGLSYGKAFVNSYKIGEELAIFFNDFVNLCNCLDKIHHIGFSIGAQIMSFTGKNFNKANANKFPMMTGLEPAGPLYVFDHLEQSDASFVSVIHTDAGLYGTTYKSGAADFWPNGGTSLQPGCSLSTASNCSHYQACNYYANSIRHASIYQSQLCYSYAAWKLGLCNLKRYAIMGYAVSNTAYGNYFLDT